MRSLDVERHQSEFFELIRAARYATPDGPCNFQKWVEACAALLEPLAAAHARVFLIGNGASQAMSSHYAADLTKNGMVPALALSDAAMITCFSNDYSYEDAIVEMLKRHLGPRDVLLAISSSGMSPNVVRAAEYVRSKKQTVIALTGFKPENALRKLATHDAFLANDSYGYVECAHAYVMHALLDVLCVRRGATR